MRGRQDARISSVLSVVAVLCLILSYIGANIEAHVLCCSHKGYAYAFKYILAETPISRNTGLCSRVVLIFLLDGLEH